MTNISAKYINPFTDYGFKKLFGEDSSEEILIDFLNSALPIPYKITRIEFKNNENQGDTKGHRKAIYDIFCEDEKGNKFIVEMQNSEQTYFKDRALFYSGFPVRDGAIKGDWDYKLPYVYVLSLLNFEIEDADCRKEHINDDSYVQVVQLKDQNNRVFYDKLTFVYIELPKFKKVAPSNKLEKWIYFLKKLSTTSNIPDVLNEDIFKKAYSIAQVANLSDNQKDIYIQSLLSYYDRINTINSAVSGAESNVLVEGILNMHNEGDSPEKIQRVFKAFNISLDYINTTISSGKK